MVKILYLIILLFCSDCNSGQSEKNDQSKGELIFHSGFEADSKVIIRNNGDADITGADKSFTDHNDWVESFDNHPNIGNFNLQYQGGDTTMRYAKIIPEPGNPSNNVLKFWLDAPNVGGSKGRIQGNIYGNNGLYEFYQSVRIFLHDDFNTVKEFPKAIHWLTLAEFWNNITWSQSVPYRFRITLGIGKEAGAGNNLHFILDAQDCELFETGGQKYNTIWAENNKETDVPVGSWFTLDLYYKEGNAETGKFYLAMTTGKNEKKVIFDLTRITHNTVDPQPDGVGDFNPIKLYTSKELIDFMHSRGKTLQMFWDDYSLWKDRSPY
jgi:hypothetical protein